MCIDTVIVCKTGLRQINSSSFSLLHISDQMMFLFFFYRKRNVRRNRVCDGMKTGRDIALGHFTRGEGVFWKSPPPRVSQSDWTFSIGKNIKIKTGFSTNTVLHYNISCRLIKTRFSIHIPVVSKTCEKGGWWMRNNCWPKQNTSMTMGSHAAKKQKMQQRVG